MWFSTLILSVTLNPDLHGLINLISIDNLCDFVVSTFNYVKKKEYFIHSDLGCVFLVFPLFF